MCLNYSKDWLHFLSEVDNARSDIRFPPLLAALPTTYIILLIPILFLKLAVLYTTCEISQCIIPGSFNSLLKNLSSDWRAISILQGVKCS